MAALKTFKLTTFKLGDYSKTGFSIIIDFQPTPSKIVQASNLKELQPLFDAWVKEVAATGAPYKVDVLFPRQQASKPPGFDKAGERGGSLRAFVNVDKCKEFA